jgi:hypothetical protein
MSNNRFGLPAGLGSTSHNNRSSGVYEAPTDFVDLPSEGKFYPKESPLYGVEKLEVRYMTAKEEDLLVSPGLIKAGVAMDRVIESLLIDKRIRAKDLLVGDKSAILINIRKNAFGEDYEFGFYCTKCGELNKHTKDLNEITIKELVSDENCSITEHGTIVLKLPKSKTTVELKFLRGEDETAIEQVVEKRAKNNLAEESLLVRYRYMILSVNGNTDMEAIVSFIETMPVLDSRILRKKYSELNPDILLNYSADCSKCGHTNEGGVPIMADFFWPKL